MTKEDFQTILKPVTVGFFGKPGGQGEECSHFNVHPLGEMLADLADIRPEEWYGYAFSREPLNGKFQNEQRRVWMEKGLACGREYAKKICDMYRTKDPRELAKAMGMDLSFLEFPEKMDRVLFAEFCVPNKICIYMDAVRKAEKLFESPGVAAVLTRELDVSGLILSHELFHWVEEQYHKDIFTRTEKIRLWSLGFLHNDSNIIALGEIGAMGFAQEIAGISYSPYLMDIFLVYGYSPKEASGLYEEMMELAGRKMKMQ